MIVPSKGSSQSGSCSSVSGVEVAFDGRDGPDPSPVEFVVFPDPEVGAGLHADTKITTTLNSVNILPMSFAFMADITILCVSVFD
jgi:hypothetical protein